MLDGQVTAEHGTGRSPAELDLRSPAHNHWIIFCLQGKKNLNAPIGRGSEARSNAGMRMGENVDDFCLRGYWAIVWCGYQFACGGWTELSRMRRLDDTGPNMEAGRNWTDCRESVAKLKCKIKSVFSNIYRTWQYFGFSFQYELFDI